MEGAVTGLTLTNSMFSGLLSTITTNLGVLIPVRLTIMGIMVAVSLILELYINSYNYKNLCPVMRHLMS